MADCELVKTQPTNAPDIPIYLSQAHRGQRVEVQLYDRNGNKKQVTNGVVELMISKLNNYLDRYVVFDLIHPESGPPVPTDPAVSYCKYSAKKKIICGISGRKGGTSF